MKKEPKPITKAKKASIIWDFAVQTDRKIKSICADLVNKNNKKKTCHLIDMSGPKDNNKSVKEYYKISKYKDLKIEMEKYEHWSTTNVPVILGALGMIKKRKYKHK